MSPADRFERCRNLRPLGSGVLVRCVVEADGVPHVCVFTSRYGELYPEVENDEGPPPGE